MPNVMVTPPNIGGALCSMPQSWADAHYLMQCSNTAKTRKPLKFAGEPQTTRSISVASGPKFTILWGHMEDILLLFRLSICALVAKIQSDRVVRWCPDGDFWRLFCILCFSEPRAAGLMADIQSAAAEIRRGKKEKNKPQHENIYGLPYYIGRP